MEDKKKKKSKSKLLEMKALMSGMKNPQNRVNGRRKD